MNTLEKIKLLPSAMAGFLFCDPQRNGEYRFLQRLIREWKNHYRVVFDIGANTGEYAARVLATHSNTRLYCFEPSQITFKQLATVFESDDRVVLEQMALSERVGVAEFYLYGDTDQRNSLEQHSGTPVAIDRVLVGTIDGYCNDHGINSIDFMKVDVESHEFNVLMGARQMLHEKKIGAIQFEYNVLWRNTSYTLEATLSLLDNYKIYRLTPWGKIWIPQFKASLENYPPASNYVAFLK